MSIVDTMMCVSKAPKTAPIRVTVAAVDLARIASGYTGESVAEYVSRIVMERANIDVDELHGKRFGASKPRR
jgi:hypothetical protein